MLEALSGAFKWAAFIALAGIVAFFMTSNNTLSQQKDATAVIAADGKSIDCDYYRAIGDAEMEKECRGTLVTMRVEQAAAHKAASKRQATTQKQGDQVVEALLPKAENTGAQSTAPQAGKPAESPF